MISYIYISSRISVLLPHEDSNSMMLRSRRGLHSEKHAEEDSNNKEVPVHKKCCTCGKLNSTEVHKEDEQLENKSGDNIERHSNSSLDLGIAATAKYICEDCGKNERNKNNAEGGICNSSVLRILGLILLASITIIITYLLKSYYMKNVSFEVKVYNQTQEEINFDNELYGLEVIYKRQKERVWYTFAAGIKSVTAEQPNKPSVFLLLYDNDQAGKTVTCLAQDVTKVASKYLKKQDVKPLMFAGKQLNREDLLNDPGLLLTRLKKPVENSGAMIVTSLQDVHPKVAASFHFICDRFSPLVEKAIFVFTLKVKEIPDTSIQKVAEDALKSLWAKDLPENKLSPLITRMTGNVLQILTDYSGCSF